MLSKLLKLWDDLRSSYWFIPSIMSLGAMLNALYLTQASWILDMSLLGSSEWFYQSTPEAARQVLSTIAGSMIAVASVTFSITIASVAYATSQFGPRLLTNFMADRGNQFTLGTFIATFLYCLMVLRTITGSDGDPNSAEIVPQIALAVGVLFAVVSIGVLIYFIHHVPASIHASNVIANVGRQLLAQVNTLYPEGDDEGEMENANASGNNRSRRPSQDEEIDLADSQVITADFDGFVQFIDEATLLELARKLDCAIVLDVRPGDFVHAGSYLAWVLTSDALDADQQQCICGSFLYGDKRTSAQDVMFLARELVEIAARTLSPGVNDPFTAMSCMDWLSSSLAIVATRNPISDRSYTDDGELRLAAKNISPEFFIDQNLTMIRPYAATDRNAGLHFQLIIGGLLLLKIKPHMRSLLVRQSSELVQCAKGRVSDLDFRQLQERHEVLESMKSDSRGNETLARKYHWLGGSA